MYNHQEIKEKARMHINGNTNSKIVALIFTLLCSGAGASFGGGGGGSSSSSSSTSSLNDDEAAIIAGIMLIVAGIFLFALLIAAVFSASRTGTNCRADTWKDPPGTYWRSGP